MNDKEIEMIARLHKISADYMQRGVSPVAVVGALEMTANSISGSFYKKSNERGSGNDFKIDGDDLK